MSKITYKSKIDLFLLVLIIGSVLFSGLAIMLSINEFSYMSIATLFVAIFFVGHIFFTTYYVIKDQKFLLIKSSFLINKKIDISSIKKIKETNNIISSPALSLDRLEVLYNKYDSVIISPKNKINFINDIKLINNSIVVERNKK